MVIELWAHAICNSDVFMNVGPICVRGERKFHATGFEMAIALRRKLSLKNTALGIRQKNFQ